MIRPLGRAALSMSVETWDYLSLLSPESRKSFDEFNARKARPKRALPKARVRKPKVKV